MTVSIYFTSTIPTIYAHIFLPNEFYASTSTSGVGGVSIVCPETYGAEGVESLRLLGNFKYPKGMQEISYPPDGSVSVK